MEEKTKLGILIIVIIALIVSVIYIAHETWTLGDKEADYKIVCIGGHEYYWANFAYKGLLGIRLSNNGKPIKCNK